MTQRFLIKINRLVNFFKAKHVDFQMPIIQEYPFLMDAPLSSYKPYLQGIHEVF